MCYETVALLNNFKEWKWQILRFYANKDFNLDSCRHDKTGSITNMALLWFVWSWQVKGQKKLLYIYIRVYIYIYMLGLLYSPNYWATVSHTVCKLQTLLYDIQVPFGGRCRKARSVCVCVCVCVCVSFFCYHYLQVCMYNRMLEIHQY